MKKEILISILSAGVLAMSGCSGSSDDNNGDGKNGGTGDSPTTLSAQFIDSAVAGLGYDCQSSGKSGLTDTNGYFNYVSGDTCTFKVGDITLGSAQPTGSVFTPRDLTTVEPNLTNTLRLLQTLDKDENLSNGISLPSGLTGTLALDGDFDAEINAFLANNSITNTVVTAGDAKAHFEKNGGSTDNGTGGGTDNGTDGGTTYVPADTGRGYDINTTYGSMSFFLNTGGVGYICDDTGVSGKTAFNGTFECKGSETVSFSIGHVHLGSFKMQYPFTVYSIFPDDDVKAENLMQLILTLDSTPSAINGIDISDNIDIINAHSYDFEDNAYSGAQSKFKLSANDFDSYLRTIFTYVYPRGSITSVINTEIEYFNTGVYRYPTENLVHNNAANQVESSMTMPDSTVVLWLSPSYDVDQSLTFEEAKQVCSDLGARLPTILEFTEANKQDLDGFSKERYGYLVSDSDRTLPSNSSEFFKLKDNQDGTMTKTFYLNTYKFYGTGTPNYGLVNPYTTYFNNIDPNKYIGSVLHVDDDGVDYHSYPELSSSVLYSTDALNDGNIVSTPSKEFLFRCVK